METKIVLGTAGKPIRIRHYAELPFKSTSLGGHVDATYAEVVKAFGEPNGEGCDKVDVEWEIDTPYGRATIYNYKDGPNYLGGERGTIEADKSKRQWHIGTPSLIFCKGEEREELPEGMTEARAKIEIIRLISKALGIRAHTFSL